MTPLTLHPIIIYIFIGVLMGSFSVIIMFMLDMSKKKKSDYIIFIDNNNRWSLVMDKLKDTDTYTFKEKKYILAEDRNLLNNKGKALYIFSENKPQPMNIEFNNAKWLSSDSMMSVINNKLIQKLVQTSDSFLDKLLMFGAIGGMLAAVLGAVVLAKTFGVI